MGTYCSEKKYKMYWLACLSKGQHGQTFSNQGVHPFKTLRRNNKPRSPTAGFKNASQIPARLRRGCYLHTRTSASSWAHQHIRFLRFLHLNCLWACLHKVLLRNNLTRSPAQRPVNDVCRTFARPLSIHKSSYANCFAVAPNSSFPTPAASRILGILPLSLRQQLCQPPATFW